MKNIVDFINEGMINEAGNLTVVAFDPDVEDRTFVISNCTIADVKKLEHTAMVCASCVIKPSNLLFLMHSDESPMVVVTPSLPALKKACWDEYQMDMEYPTFDTLGVGTLAMYDEKECKNENDLWKSITKFIEDSEVDGDSSSVYALVDPKKQEEIAVGKTDIIFYNSYKEFVDEIFSEE